MPPSNHFDQIIRGVKNYLDVCSSEHPECAAETRLQPSLTDLKVIDCTTRTIVAAPQDCSFVALSYVWGTDQTTHGLHERLPQTIEDALAVAVALDFRYLWVDRYCIKQDSIHKHNQIQQMGAIYSRAEITIIAAAGEDPTYGLPGISRPFLEYNDFFSGNLRNSKWASRAWTFQEGFLSQKALFFTEPYILLKCEKAVQAAETSNVPMTSLIRDFPGYEDVVDEELRGWRLHKNDRKIADMMRVLEEYVKRDLGFETDALNAIVGILNVFTIMNRSLNHLWGLPYAWEESNLTVALFWSNQSRNANRRPGFPSWSPTGWTGKIIIFEPEHNQFTEGKDVEIRIMGDNNVPEILSGKPGLATFASQCLRVTAYSCRAFQTDISLRVPNDHRLSGHYVVVAVTGHEWGNTGDAQGMFLKIRWNDNSYVTDTLTELICIFTSCQPWRRCNGLVLKSHGQYFERIGSFNQWEVPFVPALDIPEEVRLAEMKIETFLIR